MLRSAVALFCLSCGAEMPEPLRRTASLRCLDCREAGEPISFELALRAREVLQAQAVAAFDNELFARRPAV